MGDKERSLDEFRVEVLGEMKKVVKGFKNADKELLEDVAGAIRWESESDPREARLPLFGDLWGWAQRFFVPVFQLIWRFISFLLLAIIFSFVGLFRLSNWVFTFRIFWIFVIFGWVSTAVVVANYEVITDIIRPGFQVIDDIVFRGIYPIANDLLAISLRPFCKWFNFIFSIVLVGTDTVLQVLRLWVKCTAYSFEGNVVNDTDLCDLGTINDAFIDDYILGVEWADLINPSARRNVLSGMPLFVKTEGDSKSQHEQFLDYITQNMGYYEKEEFYRNFTRWSDDGGKWTRYDPAFLNAANIGFDFGWDPEVATPQITGPGIGYDVYETLYQIIAFPTELMTLLLNFFLVLFERSFAETIVLITEYTIVCTSTTTFDLTVLAADEFYKGFINQTEDQPVPAGEFFGIIGDLFTECIADFFTELGETIILENIIFTFRFVINLLAQIPCLRFDSIGCFIGSIFECILGSVFEWSVPDCLGCAEDDEDCIETECRGGGSGLVPLLDCFFQIAVDIAADAVCPVAELLFCNCELILDVLGIFGAALESLEEICNTALDSISFDIGKDFTVLDYDFGFGFNIDINVDKSNFDNVVKVNTDDDNDDDANSSPSDDLFCYVFDKPFAAAGSDFDVDETIDTVIDEACDVIFDVLDGFCEGDDAIGSAADCRDDHPFAPVFDLIPDFKRDGPKRISRRDLEGLFKDGSYVFDKKENEIVKKKNRIFMSEEENIEECRKNQQCYAFDQDKDAESLWKRSRSPSKRIAGFFMKHIDPHIQKNVTVDKIVDEISMKIRKDKIAHLLFSSINPNKNDEWDDWYAERLQRRIERYDKHYGEKTSKTAEYDEIRGHPRSLYQKMKRLDFARDTLWDEDSEYADHFRSLKGNLTSVAVRFFSIFGTIFTVRYPGPERTSPSTLDSFTGVRFPYKREIESHFENVRLDESLMNLFTSSINFMHHYKEANGVNVERFIRDFDKSYDRTDAPSVRHRHLYVTKEETKGLKNVIKRYQAENMEYSTHNSIRSVIARTRTFIHITAASLFTPHRLDYVVNKLAMAGPEYDAPITNNLKVVGRNRKFMRITDDVYFWKTDIVGKTPYTALDYTRELNEAKDILDGKVDQEKALQNGLYNRSIISRKRARELKSKFPFLKHPVPSAVSTREQHLRNAIELHERIEFIGFSQVLFQNPEILLSSIPLVLASPLGETTAKLWSNFVVRTFGNIFFDYVDFSLSELADVSRDIAETLVFNIIYLANYLVQNGFTLFVVIVRVVIQVAVEIPLTILNFLIPILSFIFKAFWAMITAAAVQFDLIIFFAPVPPNPLTDSRGAPTQNPLGYINDVFTCDPSEATCESNSDCIGGAYCSCPLEQGIYWKTTFYEITPSGGTCTGKTGRCACFPTLPCDALLPVVPLASIITPDCRKFGYDLSGQVWYASKGSYADRWWRLTQASVENFVAQTKFAVRSVFVGWNTFLNKVLFVAVWIMAISFTAVILRSVRYTLLILFLGTFLFVLELQITEFAVNELLPFVEDLADGEITFFDLWYFDEILERFMTWFYIDKLFGEILEFIRFPNHSPANPLGSPDLVGGEFTCFIIGLFSGVPGAFFLFIMVMVGFLLFSTGFIRLLFVLSLFAILAILRMIWSFVWFVLKRVRDKNQYDRITDYVINKEWAERMSRLATRVEDASTPSNMFASARKRMSKLIPRVRRSEAERTQIEHDLKTELKEQRKDLDKQKRLLRAILKGKKIDTRTTFEEEEKVDDIENVRSIDRRARLESIGYQPGDLLFERVGDFLEEAPARISRWWRSGDMDEEGSAFTRRSHYE